MGLFRHQYIDRVTGRVRDETLYSDGVVTFLYDTARELLPPLFRAATSRTWTRLMGWVNYDMRLGARITGNQQFLRRLGVDLSECVDSPQGLDTARRIFERRIRYWQCRPMPDASDAIVSPADSRMLVGSFADTSALFIKEKFFAFGELLGDRGWSEAFAGGEFAVFRLTPDKYHWNHAPVAGVVRDIYAIDGAFHSCNPGAVVSLVTPYSKNRRVVTLIDTDVPDGTQCGLVAMIEIVAMMIGRIEQRYSEEQYNGPRQVEPGMFLRKGQPKSLYQPGSSTDVLIFQPGRVLFAPDIVANMSAAAQSRFTHGFGQPLVETDVRVRSWIGNALGAGIAGLGRTHL